MNILNITLIMFVEYIHRSESVSYCKSFMRSNWIYLVIHSPTNENFSLRSHFSEVTSKKSLFRSELSIIDCRICTNCLLDHYSTGLRIARDCNLNKIKLDACLVSQTADPDYQSVITNHWLGRQYTVSRQYTIRLERSAEVVDPTEKGPTNREPPKRDQPKEANEISLANLSETRHLA